MSQAHYITREIGIDAGHRVTHHGSKCRNVHGHRYTIQATCAGPLFDAGEQQGMVLDFGFLKEEMIREIDEPCDHGMILWVDDPLIPTFITGGWDSIDNMKAYVRDQGKYLAVGSITSTGKVYVVPFVPTAENLARHWFGLLTPRVEKRSKGKARLVNVKVWETPNCSAEYPGFLPMGE